MAPPATPGHTMAQANARRDLRGPGRVAVALLVAIIALNLAGIAWGTAEGWPGRLDGVWVILLGAAGIWFLRWFVLARRNTASYGPGRVRVYPAWTVAGWICPVACLWVPYRITAEILRASAAAAGTGSMCGGRPAWGGLLRWWWWALWTGMWLTLWGFAVAYLMAGFSGWGVTAPQEMLDLAFQLLSIGAAACAAAVVVIITRYQGQRPGEPVTRSEHFPRAVPAGLAWRTAATAAVAFPLLAVAFVIAGRDTAGLALPLADLAPTAAEITGTWHARDGGTLVFTRDGRFVASGLSIDLADNGAPAAAHWSGSGTWRTGGTCDRGAPGICLTIGLSGSEDGWTQGAASSPILLLPAVSPGEDYDSSGCTYEFRK